MSLKALDAAAKVFEDYFRKHPEGMEWASTYSAPPSPYEDTVRHGVAHLKTCLDDPFWQCSRSNIMVILTAY